MDINELLIDAINVYYEKNKSDDYLIDYIFPYYINKPTKEKILDYVRKCNMFELLILLKHISCFGFRNDRGLKYKCKGLLKVLKLQMNNVEELNNNVDLINTINELREENEKLKNIIKMI